MPKELFRLEVLFLIFSYINQIVVWLFMLDIEHIRNLFPCEIRGKQQFDSYFLREYLQLMILDYLFFFSPFYSKLTLIGGANLRIIQNIDRFTEDIDFDCKELGEEDFIEMTNSVINYLNNYVNVVPNDKRNPKLTAFQRVLVFPSLFPELEIEQDKQMPFKLKIQAQDQHIPYQIERAFVKRGMFQFYVQVPSLDVLCAMKFASILSSLRKNASDYYDIPFLLSKTSPNLDFLKEKTGISSIETLKASMFEKLKGVNLCDKKKWIERLLMNDSSMMNIFQIKQCIASM